MYVLEKALLHLSPYSRMVRLITLLIVENILVMDAIFNPLSMRWSRNKDASDVEYSSIGLSPKRFTTVFMFRSSAL